jgi:hypothetical protein
MAIGKELTAGKRFILVVLWAVIVNVAGKL